MALQFPTLDHDRIGFTITKTESSGGCDGAQVVIFELQSVCRTEKLQLLKIESNKLTIQI